jgi:hypothetical protein
MRELLRPHPNSNGLPAIQIAVEVRRPQAGVLALSYTVTGRLDDVHLPAVAPAARGDELWRSTCFEAFVRASTADAYCEFNFAPSARWAIYRFNGYRSGRRAATEIGAPAIDIVAAPGRFTLNASVELDRADALPASAAWRLGLAAVIEDRAGRKSYWALAHPPGKPDFHHTDCFARDLSSTVRS